MQFSISANLQYNVIQPSIILLNIHALKTEHQAVWNEKFFVDPSIRPVEFLTSNGQNRFVRLETGESATLSISYSAMVDQETESISFDQIRQNDLGEIPRDVIPYLFPSRYCQSDKLSRFAFKTFGGYQDSAAKAQAICDWVHDNIEYLPGTSNDQTSAFDTVTERAGVCRDFAHLGITLCRALSIPARYFAGYAHQLQPPDFHACFEVYLGGHWVIFDPTRMSVPNGLVRIAHGRDAADASTATIFGAMELTSMEVCCQSSDPSFSPAWIDGQTAYSLGN